MRYAFYAGLWLFASVAVPEVVRALPAAQGTGRVALGAGLRTQEPEFMRLVAEADAPAKLRRVVSVDADGWSLARTLDEIARQLDLPLIYDTLVTGYRRPTSAKLDRVTGAAAILRVLRNTGLQLDVAKDGSAARVRPAAGKRVSARPGAAGSLVGKVTGAKTDQPLAAAEVLLEGTRWRTATDSAGRYRLADVDEGTYVLLVRRLGYIKQSRRVTVRDGQTDTVDVALAPGATQLDSLVTTATGQQRRRDLGNAITTIRADSVLKSAPIRNLTDLLATRVPGLTVQHTTGAPGDPAKLRLRGLGSALRSNDPVVIVDNVRIYAAQSEARSGNLTNLLPSGGAGTPAPSPLDQIDPNTIDKIEVFKGPSAATLYGADAANGVIVITTKRGKPGPTVWSASLSQGRTTQPGLWPTGYYRWGHDLFNNVPVFCTVLNTRCVQDSLVQFQALNDPNLTVLGRGRRTAASLTASGGTQALTYSVTGSYGDETGLLRLPDFEVERFRTLYNHDAPDWMQQPHHYKDWSVTSNITARLSAAADLTLLTRLSRAEQQRTALEDQLAPLLGTYVDTVNRIYYRPTTNYVLQSNDAVLHDYYQRTTTSTITFTTGLSANWHPRSWFTASGQAGLDVSPRDDQTLLPGGLLALTDSGAVTRGTGRSLVSTCNVQGTVRKPLAHDFVFQTSLGANFTTTTTSDLVSSARGLIPGTSGLTGAAHFAGAADGRGNTSVFGWYLEPNISGRTFAVSTGFRLDGGSAYGARITRTGGGGGGFLRNLLALPKLGGTWVVSEEPWFPFQTLFSSLRLRGAYGQAQVQPGAADRLRLYDQSVLLTHLGNTELRPERSTEVEGGFDADLLNSRVSVELTAYRKLQVDALMNVQLPGSVDGGASVLKNIGNIRNTGLELTLGVTPVQSSALTWSTQLSYSRNNNALLKLGRGVEPNPSVGLVAGYPVGSRWTLPILGFADQNGDGVLQAGEIQVGDSMVYVGRLLPAYTAALHSNVVLFGGAVGITASLSYDAGATQVNAKAHDNWVLTRALIDPSAPLREQAAVLASDQTIQAQGFTGQTDYGLMEEVSTLRFHSLSVNYRAPERVARLLGAQTLSVAVQGSNLGLHSTYRGKDPDVNAWGPGENVRDNGQLPQPRTWQLSLFLQY